MASKSYTLLEYLVALENKIKELKDYVDGYNGVGLGEINNQINAIQKQISDIQDQINNSNTPNEQITNMENQISNLRSQITNLQTQINEIIKNGTNVELIQTTTRTEIQRLVDDGTIDNMTIADNSITTNKLADYCITQEKIDPNVKLGGGLNVRDLNPGESVVNISGITGDKYLEALFDFTTLTSDSTQLTDERNNSKFFSLSTVEPYEQGAYALGYNGQMTMKPQSYSVGIVFRGNRTNRTGLFKFSGNVNSAINYEDASVGSGFAITHTGYYGRVIGVPFDLETFIFLLVGVDMVNDVMNIWINGVKKGTFPLDGRQIGNKGYLNNGFWSDGSFIFNKIGIYNKGNFNDREIKAITEHLFTVPKYINVDTSKSFLSIKNGLVRHLTIKNNTDGIIKDIVYNDTIRNTTSVTSEGFVLSERTLLNPNYSINCNGGGIFIRFDKNSVTDNQYLFKYSDTQYLWINFSTNKICCRDEGKWIIQQRDAQFTEKNVLYFDNSNKIYLNGKYLCDTGSTFENTEKLIKDLQNVYPLKDYVCYVEPLNAEEIKTISAELCSY